MLYAHEDLRTARGMVEAMNPPRHACLLAQQAGEKALKALLIVVRTPFPKTHDLDRLRTLLPDGLVSKDTPPDLSTLSEWAVESRYPGSWPEASAEDASVAIEEASAVLQAVRDDLASLGWPDRPPD